MAEQYDNTNSFALFKNDKGDNEARPDYTGTVTLEGGKEMKMAAWIKTSQSGLKFLSGRISEPQVKSDTNNASVEGADADIPF